MTEKQPFTPGPWGVEVTETTNWIGPLRHDGKVNEIVSKTDREGLKPEAMERNDANAKLIAAAPDFYQSLLLIAEGFETADELRDNDFGLEYEEALAMAYENMQSVAIRAVKMFKHGVGP